MKRNLTTWTSGLTVVLLLAAVAAAQPMTGTYTINPTWPVGGTPYNYQSFAAAVAALTTNTVGGPVVFNVYDDGGPYVESATFASVNVTWGTNTAVVVFRLWTGVSATNTVTFQAGAGESPVLDATGRSMGVAWNGANYTTIRGLEIKNALYDAVCLYNESAMNANGPTGNVIEGCRIHHCPSAGVTIYGNGTGVYSTTIRNNFFWHLQTANSGGFATNARFGYIATRRDNSTVIEFNTFYVDTGTGTEFCVIGSLPGAPATPYSSVRNNLIVKLAGVGATRPIFNFREAGYIPTVMNNNVYDDASGGPFLKDVGTTYATLGAFQGSTYAPREGNSRTGIANLVNGATGDLHIQLGSAAIGAAVTIAAVTTDIDGQTRPQGCATDVGADEIAELGPIAAFTATPISGPAPLTVQFTDVSQSCTTGITNWAWDFTGTAQYTSNLQNPSFTYTCPGTYSITLVVTDPNGSAMVTVNNMINVGDFQFSMTSTLGTGNLTVTPVPTTCATTSAAIEGYTLLSLVTTSPVGQGLFFGMDFDGLTLQCLASPIGVGWPLHFAVTPTTYPNGGPLILPPGTMAALIGATMDGMQVLVSAQGTLVHWSNVARVSF